jgi:hypothetical protein
VLVMVLVLVLKMLPVAVIVMLLSLMSKYDRSICEITDAASLAKGGSIPYTYKAAVPVGARGWYPPVCDLSGGGRA